MAVLGSREILPRTFEHRIGDSPSAGRVFVATVDAPTAASEVLAAIGITHGASHPEHATLTCLSYSVDETDRHHVTVTYTYGIPDKDKNEPDNPDQPPWLQPDTWSFGTSNASVACTEHYPFNLPGGAVNVAHPLTNTAGDIIFGQTKAESELKISISGSRLTLDLAKIKKYVNTINSAPWAGFPKHTVQCVGVSASPARLDFDGQALDYWQITIELIYRSSSHNLFLPNVGWNVIVDGKKQRAWTYIAEDGVSEKVPTPHPVALNAAGGFLCGPKQDGNDDWNGGTDSDGDPATGYY